MLSKSHYDHLKARWLDRQQVLKARLSVKHPTVFTHIKNSFKHAAVGTAGAVMLLAAPVPSDHADTKTPLAAVQTFVQDVNKRIFLISDLSQELPGAVEQLSPFQESVVVQTLSRHFHLDITAQLQGIRLNRTYGYIGQEQHLARYPGDNMSTHFDTAEQATAYADKGMAPGLGAWGYFAPSQQAMTQQDSDREKYYIAVQTFLAPGYADHVAEYNAFFKYRKMLVVNPQNGKAMVVVIGDAGPGTGTGKQLGGSPEVMKYLERVDGAQKGPVLYFFITDPNDTIPLGPIDPVE